MSSEMGDMIMGLPGEEVFTLKCLEELCQDAVLITEAGRPNRWSPGGRQLHITNLGSILNTPYISLSPTRNDPFAESQK